jgi:hypothetical protein
MVTDLQVDAQDLEAWLEKQQAPTPKGEADKPEREGSGKTDEQGGDSTAEISGKKRPGKSAGRYYVPFRGWLLPEYISGRLSIDDDVAPAVPGITGAWERYCEAKKLPEPARKLPGDRRLRQVIREIRDEARAAKGD